MPDHIEKYIKSSDFIKALIEARKDKTISMQQLKVILLKFLLEMQHYLDYEEIFNLMFKYRVLDTLFDFAESLELQESSREQFAVEFFRYTMIHDMPDMTILIQDHYEVFLFKQTDNCIEAIIQSCQKNSLHMRLKTHILTQFMEVLKYQQVERLLNALESFITGDIKNTYLVSNVNPMLTGVKIINVLFLMSKRYPVCEFRASTLIEMLTDQCRQILVNLYMPTELKISVRRKDLDNHNSLYYMELMDAFKLMDTKVMDRIMKEYWNSNIDTSGSFF